MNVWLWSKVTIRSCCDWMQFGVIIGATMLEEAWRRRVLHTFHVRFFELNVRLCVEASVDLIVIQRVPMLQKAWGRWVLYATDVSFLEVNVWLSEAPIFRDRRFRVVVGATMLQKGLRWRMIDALEVRFFEVNVRLRSEVTISSGWYRMTLGGVEGQSVLKEGSRRRVIHTLEINFIKANVLLRT